MRTRTLHAPDLPSRTRRGRRGGNAIEFALTLPFFLMLVLGMVDYGYMFMIQAGLDNAVSMACREGAMADPNFSNPVTVANAELSARSAYFCDGGPACSRTVVDRSAGIYAPPNRTLECRVRRTMTPLIGFVPFPPSLDSVSYYRLEWQRN